MALDPTKHADWEIAEESEKRMKPIAEIAAKMGLHDGRAAAAWPPYRKGGLQEGAEAA